MKTMVAITGALSYTGKYATQLMLARGYHVRTLTYHPQRPNPFGGQLEILPYNFDRPDQLTRSLIGVTTLINTYWIRFPRGNSTFETAVRTSRILIDAAKVAGVRRIVHVSIANPSLQSPLAYYKGKAEVEDAVVSSGLSYAILRPTVIFGTEDILINNIAWFVRHFPLFAIPGNGWYRLRPIYVEDMARLLVDSIEIEENSVRDAVGPETFSFTELIHLIADRVGMSVRCIHVPMTVAYLATLITGWILRDVVLTWEEYEGLMHSLLASDAPSAGDTLLSDWLAKHAETIGRKYASEVARHYAKTTGI
jgi:uncharacterized protein YbjT (DUF2867 family)